MYGNKVGSITKVCNHNYPQELHLVLKIVTRILKLKIPKVHGREKEILLSVGAERL